jgi:hypothetical protein
MHEMPLFQVAEPAQQISHPQRHRGLPRSGLAGEAHVQVGPGRLQAEPLPHPVDQQKRGDLFHLLLDRDQADQISVQGPEHLVNTRGAALIGKGHGGVWVQRLAALPGAGLRGPEKPAASLRLRRGPGRGRISLARLTPGVTDGHDRHRCDTRAGDANHEPCVR